MKRIKKLDIDFKIYKFVQFFLLIVPILSLFMIYFLALQRSLTVTELMETSPVTNMIFLVAMINAVCWIELYYFKKRLQENLDFSVIMVNLAIIALVEFMVLNMPVSLCLIYFIHSTMKKNKTKLKKQFAIIRRENTFLVPIINFAILMFAVLICYKLLML